MLLQLNFIHRNLELGESLRMSEVPVNKMQGIFIADGSPLLDTSYSVSPSIRDKRYCDRKI